MSDFETLLARRKCEESVRRGELVAMSTGGHISVYAGGGCIAKLWPLSTEMEVKYTHVNVGGLGGNSEILDLHTEEFDDLGVQVTIPQISHIEINGQRVPIDDNTPLPLIKFAAELFPMGVALNADGNMGPKKLGDLKAKLNAAGINYNGKGCKTTPIYVSHDTEVHGCYQPDMDPQNDVDYSRDVDLEFEELTPELDEHPEIEKLIKQSGCGPLLEDWLDKKSLECCEVEEFPEVNKVLENAIKAKVMNAVNSYSGFKSQQGPLRLVG